MRLSLIPAFILLLPLAEIAGFVIVGKAIGLWATLGLVLLGTFFGAALLRGQGLSILQRLSQASNGGGVPGKDLVHGAMIFVAGFLLLIPGSITDLLGLLLLVPGIREIAWKYLSRRIVILGSSPAFNRSRGGGPQGEPGEQPRGAGPVVDLDAEDFQRKGGNSNSPWSDAKRLGD